MNKEIRNKEIREEDLEKVNGGIGLNIVSDFDITIRDQKNREINENSTELDDDMLNNVTGGTGIPAMLNPFGNDPDTPLPGFDGEHNAPEKN